MHVGLPAVMTLKSRAVRTPVDNAKNCILRGLGNSVTKCFCSGENVPSL